MAAQKCTGKAVAAQMSWEKAKALRDKVLVVLKKPEPEMVIVYTTFVVITRNLYMSLAWLGPAAWLGLGTLGRLPLGLAWLVRCLCPEFFNANKIILQ